MLPRNPAPIGNQPRTRLDAAVIASILAMAALNLLVLADQIGPAKAYAAAPCRCSTVAGLSLA